MAQSYDAIVIGGGHNGLVSAFYLAQAGKKVLVLERYHTVGGAAITEEIHPGFKLSIASYCCSLLRPEIIADMRLADYGFSLYTTSPSAFHPFPDGRYIFTYSDDHERTKAEIAKFSAKDAQGYGEWEAFWERVCDVLEPLLLAPPPSLSAVADLFEHQGMANDFRRLFYSTTTSLLGEFFETDEVAAAVVGESIIGTAAGPGTPGTPYIWLIHALGRACGQRGEWGYVRGGMGAITQAMAASDRDMGVEIRTNAEVATVLVEHGQATGVVLADGTTIRARAVLSNADPKRTFLRLTPASALPADFRTHIEHTYRSAGPVFKMNLALHELPDYTAYPGMGGPSYPATVDLCPSVAMLERAWDDCKHGRVSSVPFVEMYTQSPTDNTLAPEGKHVLSCFCQYAPYEPEGRSWDDGLREEFADRIIATIAEYAPNIKDAIIARQLLSPLDLERRFALTGGHIFHGELTPDQAMSLRPMAGFADYRTPLPGLYLCGSGAYPGGCVSGAPGHNAARVAIADLVR
jgi:phytoene dehydrogenase-like protein